MNIWLLLKEKGYEIHNKRLLGNPLYTTNKTKQHDFLQEIGLVLNWFEKKHRIIISYTPYTSGKHKYQMWKWNDKETCWKDTYFRSEEINDALNEAIKLI